LTLLLRTIAIFIAVASIVDPAWSIDRPEPEHLVVIDLSDGDAAASVSALRTALPGWEIERREGTSLVVPCEPDEQCVIVADGSIAARLPGDMRRPLSFIAVRNDRGPNVAIRSVTVATTHVSAAGAMRVDVERTGAITETTLVIRDGAAVVGTATHKWADTATASLDVPWWPLDVGARTLQVQATPVDGEVISLDNSLDVGVQVSARRVPVLVFDARPSWNSTFVRRALEDDPRVSVEYRARVAPALTAGTRSAVLDTATLESTPAVIVGDPDALTAADVALLERYVAVRGGSLILLPERRITGPATRLLAGEWSEHLVPAPERVGALHASELLRATNLPIGATVLARSASGASIVGLPMGKGTVVVSGAMDAWRYRDQGAFDRFWTSLVFDAATAGTALRIDLATSLASRGERVPFTIRRRSFALTSAAEMTVTARCGDEAPSPIRVWPTGTMHEFGGELAVSGAACVVEATAGDQVARASLAITAHPRRGVESTLGQLERAVAATGGTVHAIGEDSALATRLMASFTPTSQIVSVRPMRDWWWMFPFVGCLAIEWWLRRRDGLR